MLTIVIISFVFAVCFGFYEYKYGFYPDFESISMHLVLGMLTGVIPGLLTSFVIPSETEKINITRNLEVLNDGSSLGGDFFLGTGSIGDRPEYTFYYEENGLYRLDQVYADEASIQYHEGDPVIIETVNQETDAFINHFSIHFSKSEYLFKIPKGSIKTNYTLDAK